MANLFRYLDTNGDGSGTKNANGNYSGAEEIFYITPPANRIYHLHRMIVTVEDTSGFQASEYGNLGAALTNGIIVRARNAEGTVLANMTDDVPIKVNAQWGSLCYDVDLKTWGAGNEVLLVRFTFTKSGEFLHLCGRSGDSLEVVLNDDLTGLVGHYFQVQGTIIEPGLS